MLAQNLFAVLFSCLFSITFASSAGWYAVIKGTKHRILVQAGAESLLLNGKSNEGNKIVPFLNIKNEVIEIASVIGAETKIRFPNTPSSIIQQGKFSLPYAIDTFGFTMSITIQAPSLSSAQEFVKNLKKNISERKIKVEALEKAKKLQEEQKSSPTASASPKPKSKKNKKKSATGQAEIVPEAVESEETEATKTDVPTDNNDEKTDIIAQVTDMMDQVKIDEEKEESRIASIEKGNESPAEHSEYPSKDVKESDDDIPNDSQPAISSNPPTVAMSAFTEVPRAEEIQKEVEEEAEEGESAEYERVEPVESIGNGEPEAITAEEPKKSESEQLSWYWRVLGY